MGEIVQNKKEDCINNAYAKQIQSMVWSYSRLTSFAQCKYQFYLKYIVNNEEQYMPEGNYYAEVGSYVHKILEKIFNNELSVDDASSYFVDHFDENVFYDTKKSTMDKTFESCANYFADLSLDWINKYEIVGVEQEIDIIINGYMFTGYIDLLVKDKDTDEYIIIDHKSAKYPLSKKTGKVLKASEQSFESYKRQMYLYCKFVNEHYGVYPRWIIWNHFKDGEIVKIPFDSNEYDEAIKWFTHIIHDIENENEYNETIDYFYCNNLCEFRNSCEYNQYKDS